MNIRQFFIGSIAVLLLPAVSWSQEPANANVGIVIAPLANVHDEPLPKSDLMTQVLMADEVRILEKQATHYRIAIPSQGNHEGWIQQEAVRVTKDRGRSYLNADRQWVVITKPKTEALILDKTGNHKVPLYAGTRLPALERTPDGIKVQFPDRSVAILAPADVMPVKTFDPVMNDTTPEEIAKTARQFLGARHLAGGLTTQGMDAHGLIYIVYRVHSIPVGTEPASFKDKAERVNKKDLQPGDILVFYGENEGLFLGSGRFLQVTRKRTVQVAGIYDRRFANALQYGFRIIGAEPGRKKVPAAMTADELLLAQARVSKLPLGKRIAYWAERFIGTPYDADPLGLYVRTSRIVADEKVDCMYHTFRSVELAQTSTPSEAVNRALSLRFITQGKLEDGIVANYDQRFQYGEDMVYSGKWGKNITAEIGTTRRIPGSRGKDEVDILAKNVLLTRTVQKKLQDGDIIYWVKDPQKRSPSEEIVAHLSILHLKSGKPYLIHAAGSKDSDAKPGGGVVKEVRFADYVSSMRFIGAFVTRFDQ